MSKITLDDLTAGESWACRFWIETFLDENGEPVDNSNLQPGQRAQGQPGRYTGLGVIKTRDLANRRLVVIDTKTNNEYTLEEAQAADFDRVEWIDG